MSTSDRLGGIIHTYQKLDPVHFPSLTAPPAKLAQVFHEFVSQSHPLQCREVGCTACPGPAKGREAFAANPGERGGGASDIEFVLTGLWANERSARAQKPGRIPDAVR